MSSVLLLFSWTSLASNFEPIHLDDTHSFPHFGHTSRPVALLAVLWNNISPSMLEGVWWGLSALCVWYACMLQISSMQHNIAVCGVLEVRGMLRGSVPTNFTWSKETVTRQGKQEVVGKLIGSK